MKFIQQFTRFFRSRSTGIESRSNHPLTANPHLTPILNDWHALENPGYALLITAP